jgi:hypothetical protein
MLTLIVTGILGGIAATCLWLLRHKLKAMLIDPKCDPVVIFIDKKKTLIFKKSDVADVEAEVAGRVSAAMKNEPAIKKFPANAAFLNPLLSIEPYATEAKAKQNANNMYVRAKQTYYETTIRSGIYDEIFKPVQLVVKNKGDKACGKMQIDITISAEGANIYRSDARQQLNGQYYNRNDVYSTTSNILLTPAQQLGTTTYTYSAWDLTKAQEPEIHVVMDGLLQDLQDDTTIPLFYVDTRVTGNITIRWRIIESDLGYTGNHGTLTIEIQ